MKRKESTNKTNSIATTNWLRSTLILGLIVTFGILNFSCSKDEPVPSVEAPDAFYVKCQVNSSTINPGAPVVRSV